MNTLSPIELALEELRNGRMIIVVDDEDRENEGDLIFPAEKIAPEIVNFMAKHARGLICVALEAERVDSLALPLMSSHNRTPMQTAFTVSVEAKTGVTTGISASDRTRTIQVLTDPLTTGEDLISPGHIFPLKAQPGGVLVRTGHTEASVDLCRLAGLRPAAVICEIMNDDGTMARLPDLKIFANTHNLKIFSIRDLVAYRLSHESFIEKVAESILPSQFSETPFKVSAFKSLIDGTEHIAIQRGEIRNPTLVRVHSECLTGDAFGSLRCDCGPQLQAALKQIDQSESGVVIYMRNQEGRGIGLANKIKAYALQDRGLDTVDANAQLGFESDLRHYGIGAQILAHLGVRQIRLLTNNPKKVVGLSGYGLEIIEQVPLLTQSNPYNEKYLRTKLDRMGHLLSVSPCSKSS